MNINYLEAVLVAYRFRNFSEAADSLNMTSSAISKQISQVESELGIKLFNRATRSQAVTLTAAGSRIIADIEDEVERYHVILEKAEQIKNSSDAVLRIGYVPTVGSVGESRALTEYYTKYPGTRVQVICSTAEDLMRRMQAGALDGFFAVCGSISQDGDVEIHGKTLNGNVYSFHIMYRSSKMLIGMSNEHRYADRKSVLSSELKNETIIKNNVHLGAEWASLFPGCANMVYLDYSLPSLINEMVKSGRYILPTVMNLDVEKKYPQLRFVPVEDFSETEYCCFIYQKKFQSQNLRKFRRCIDKVSRDIERENTPGPSNLR